MVNVSLSSVVPSVRFLPTYVAVAGSLIDGSPIRTRLSLSTVVSSARFLPTYVDGSLIDGSPIRTRLACLATLVVYIYIYPVGRR